MCDNSCDSIIRGKYEFTIVAEDEAGHQATYSGEFWVS